MAPARVDLGVCRGAYGIKGWVRIAPFAPAESILTELHECWFGREGEGEAPRHMRIEAARKHGRSVVAQLAGVETPEQAERLKGAVVSVERAAFPRLKKGETYWVDLIGARVVNRAGQELGQVLGVQNFGAQDLMQVGSEAGKTLLIPMVQDYVDAIDAAAGVVQVDWAPDWS